MYPVLLLGGMTAKTDWISLIEALMRLNFYDPDPTYHEARRRFLYKGTPPPHPADQPEQMRHAF